MTMHGETLRDEKASEPAFKFVGVSIRSDNIDRDTVVYSAAAGVTPVGSGPTRLFTLADAHVMITQIAADEKGSKRGLERLFFEVADISDIDRAAHRLERVGAVFDRLPGRLDTDCTAISVAVSIRTPAPPNATSPQMPGYIADSDAPSYLDHVAILVADVPAAARRWEALLGYPPAHIGLHPLGTAIAARFLIGTRMIELLGPLTGESSPLQTRLERIGEGPYGLAIIAHDLHATLERVSEFGARIIEQPPHLIVHPGDAAGIPIQLTPRINH